MAKETKPKAAKETKPKEVEVKIVSIDENAKEVEAPTAPVILTLQDVKDKGQEFVNYLSVFIAQKRKEGKSADRFEVAKRKVNALLTQTIIE